MGSAPRPAARSLPHDAWSRRWGTALGVALILGALWPLLRVEWTYPKFGDVAEVAESRLEWPWEMSPLPWGALAVGLWIPLALGSAAVLASLALRPRPRALALLVMSIVAPTIGLTHLGAPAAVAAYLGERTADVPEIFVSCLMAAVPLTIAVGNHLRRRFPSSPSARRMTVSGGVILLACWVVPIFEGRAASSVLFEGKPWRGAPLLMIVACGTVLYGLLGILAFSRSPSGSWRWLLTSVLGRVLLLGLPLAIAALDLGRDRRGEWIRTGMIVVKSTCLIYGHVLLIAVGLAAWIESTLAAREAEPLDASRADQVFG